MKEAVSWRHAITQSNNGVKNSWILSQNRWTVQAKLYIAVADPGFAKGGWGQFFFLLLLWTKFLELQVKLIEVS